MNLPRTALFRKNTSFDAKKEKIFFMHIPKTAGSAFNNVFKPCVPEDRFFEHMESRKDLFESIQKDEQPYFISGHFTFNSVKELIENDEVFSITILRNPVEQLISHLKWVKAYGNPKVTARRKLIPKPIAELSLKLWEISLNDVEKIETIMNTPVGQSLFDNLQTRYLTQSGADKVNADQVGQAVSNMKRFNCIFILDDIDLAIKRLRGIYPNISNMQKTNQSMVNEKIDLSNPRIKDFYRLAVTHDAHLFTEIRRYSRKRYI